MAYQGINFRQTSGYVTDTAGNTYSTGEVYPTTRGGLTFGFATNETANTRNRDSSIDSRLAGIHFSTNAGAAKSFRLDLPDGPGIYRVRLGIGDYSGPQNNRVVIKDDATPLATVELATLIERFTDASLSGSGTGGNLAATWAASNVSAELNFPSGILRLELGSFSGGTTLSTALAHVAVEFVGADTTAPTLSSATDAAIGSSTATVGATTDEANGTLYAFVSTSATAPVAATLKAGTGAAWAGSQAVTSTGAKTLNATGLAPVTSYYAHLIHTDVAGNDSNIVTTAQFTTTGVDSTAPVLTAASATATGTTTATVGATTDEGNGTLYAFVSTSATPPAGATLKAGTGATWAGSVAVSGTGAKTLSATGLASASSYYAHLIHTDAAANDSNIVTSAQFTTPAPAATATTLTGPSGGQVSVASGVFTVGANGAITGTVTVTPSDGGGGGTFSPTSVAISSGTPTATFTYTPGSVGAKTISISDTGSLTDATPLTYTATLTAGTLTSSPLKNNTGTVLAAVAFEAYVSNPTSGALVVKKTGLTSNGSGVVSFSDGAVVAATSYRVVWRRTDTGAEGLETLTGT